MRSVRRAERARRRRTDATGAAWWRMPAAAALLAGCATVASATPPAVKAISITIAQQGEVRGDTLVARTTVTNAGNATARAVTTALRFGDTVVRGTPHDPLEPGATFTEELTLPTGALSAGLWPYAVTVDYADANLYPFQALLMAAAPVGSQAPPTVAIAEVAAQPLTTSGVVSVSVKNLDATARTVNYRITVPAGLEAREPTGTIELAPSGESTAEIALVNRTALPGSQYPIFVAVEYDDGGIHHGLVSQGTVAIVEPPSAWARNQTLILCAIAIVLAAWLALVVRRSTLRTT